MTLPANNTTISMSNINTELGAVGNSTVTGTNMLRSLNDFPVRYLTPGTGKTINTTASSLINMSDLNTAQVREIIGRLSAGAAGTALNWYASAVDAEGDIYILWATSSAAATFYAGKYSPQLNYFYWMKTITFNNANGSAATSITSSAAVQVSLDDRDNVIFKFSTYYVAKFAFFKPYAVAFSSDGTYLWQSDSTAGAYSISTGGTGVLKNGTVYNLTEFLMPGSNFAPGSVINNINSLTGALVANNTYAITNYSGGYSAFAGRKDQSNAYICGFGTNTTTYGIISQYSSSDTIAWSRRADAQSVFINGCVDSAGNVWAVGTTAAAAATSAPILIIKINSSGTLLFSRTITYAVNTNLPKAFCDTADNIYVVSTMIGNTTVNTNICISSLNSTGTARWHRSIRASTLATSTRNDTNCGEVSGNKLIVPAYWSNATVIQGITVHLNSSTGSTAGTYGNNVLTALTPTVTSNAAGFTTLTTVTGTLTGLSTTASANVNQAANSTPATITFNNIT